MRNKKILKKNKKKIKFGRKLLNKLNKHINFIHPCFIFDKSKAYKFNNK